MARTRSTEVHQRMIQAALRLFAERGFESTSMDAIAGEAGVSKPTLYNHWADKEALMLEVMLYVNGLSEEPEGVDTGDLARDLATVLTRRPPQEFEEARGRMMPGLIAYSATHPEFGSAWRNRVMEPPRKCLRRILQRAMDCRELPTELNLDLSICLLLGPMLYGHIFAECTPEEKNRLGTLTADAFVRAFTSAAGGSHSSSAG
jgi:AcrR family transcriptional regulator